MIYICIYISATVPSRHDSGVPPVLYRGGFVLRIVLRDSGGGSRELSGAPGSSRDALKSPVFRYIFLATVLRRHLVPEGRRTSQNETQRDPNATPSPQNLPNGSRGVLKYKKRVFDTNFPKSRPREATRVQNY